MFIWFILCLLVILLVAAAPGWRHSRDWGYTPGAILLVLVILFVCLWMFGWMPMWTHHGWWPGGMHHLSMFR